MREKIKLIGFQYVGCYECGPRHGESGSDKNKIFD